MVGELCDNSDCYYGKPCVLLDEKDEFHRAVIQSNVNTAGQYDVFLIDCGLKKVAQQQRLRQLVPEFHKIPALVSLFKTYSVILNENLVIEMIQVWKCKIDAVKVVIHDVGLWLTFLRLLCKKVQ